MSNERRRTVSALGSSEPPPQQVNVRCKSPGCGELCYPGDDYCCRFCKEIAEDKTGRLPLPPPAAVGLIGARTARPTGNEADPAQYNICDSPDCLEPACLASRSARPALWRLNFTREGEPGLPVLPTDSDERKEIPIFSGVMNYFPLALAAVARHSKRGNDKHNPGQPLHWSRAKSADHADCIARHLIDIETVSAKTGEYEEAQALAWRALAALQLLEEKRLGRGPSRGSR